MIPRNLKVPSASRLNLLAGIVTAKVSIRSVTCWVTGLIPVLFLPRVKVLLRVKVGGVPASVSKDDVDAANGIGETFTATGKFPAGDPEMGVRAPFDPMA